MLPLAMGVKYWKNNNGFLEVSLFLSESQPMEKPVDSIQKCRKL